MADTKSEIQLLLQCGRCWQQYRIDAHKITEVDHGDHTHVTFQFSREDRMLAMLWIERGHEGPFYVQDWTNRPPLSPWQSLW